MKRVCRVAAMVLLVGSGPLSAEGVVSPIDEGAEALASQDGAVAENGDVSGYAERLVAHIARHQLYPRHARLRGMQGDVTVSFTLLPGGTVSGLSTRGVVHRVLLEAAEEMIQLAQPLPMPLPTDQATLPMSVEFVVHYQLQEKTED